MSSAIIILNGYPGVGKSTVAQELSKLLPNARVVDVGLLDRVADSAVSKDARQNLRNSLRQSLLQAVFAPDSHTEQTIYILPETMLSASGDRAILSLYPTLAMQAGWPVLHFILSCSTDTNISRLLSTNLSISSAPGSTAGGRMDEAALMELRMEEEVCHLVTLKGRPKGLSGEYEIDTSDINARQVAGTVGEYVLDGLRRAGWFIQLQRR